MFAHLLDSKYESLVLAFLLVSPQRAFSIRELSKRLGMSERKIRHSIHELERLNIVKAFSKKTQKYYLIQLRTKPLLEIKDFLIKHQTQYTDELLGAVRKLAGVRAAFLSGIFTGHPELPVDLLLVGKLNLQPLEIFLRQISKMMGQTINYSVISEEEFKLRRNTFDKFIKDIFDYPHLVLVDTLNQPVRKQSKH